KYNPAIRMACKLAKITLNKCYSLSDASKLYRIAMNPQYFKMMKWEDEWHDLARDLVTSEVGSQYSGYVR
ncbi:hypothetical protein C8Q76DRAFT_577571, partial [Earliella scabrosa]